MLTKVVGAMIKDRITDVFDLSMMLMLKTYISSKFTAPRLSGTRVCSLRDDSMPNQHVIGSF